jgi:carboxyl-terminal processing protease
VVQDQLATLRKQLEPDHTEDIVRFRKDIEEVLRSELVSRYHFQTGRAKTAMTSDPYIRKAKDVLVDGSYPTILAGTGSVGK